MKRLILIVSLVLFMFVTTGCIFKETDKTEVGVRTRKLALFGKIGVEDKAYKPGAKYLILPFINDWHIFDTRQQNLEMTRDHTRGDRRTRDDLLFKTIDGNDISLDVIIQYKINPEMAPYILQYVATDNHVLKEKIIRTVARSKPRDIFGELKTEEFYVADEREKMAQKAKLKLQEILGPMGVIVENVMTKDYSFNKEYTQAIEDKKIADQREQKHRSAQHAALEEYKTKLEVARGEVNKMIADADGEYRKAQIEADVYYEKQKLLAQAIMAEGIAEAKGIQEMNNALAGSGGEAFVKLRIAEALQGKRITLLPVSEGGMNLKTTDINQLIETMGVKSLSSGQK